MKRYTKNQFEKDVLKLENFINESKEINEGGVKKYRHFKLIEADKKELNVGYVKISENASPLSAAKKLFKSLCHHRKLNGENKLKCQSTFTIQETTQDSRKKIYGPYKGHWKKLTAKEQEEAGRAGIQFTMRSVVHLVNSKTKKTTKKKTTTKKKGGSEEKEEEEEDEEEEMEGGEEDEVYDTDSGESDDEEDEYDEEEEPVKGGKKNIKMNVKVGG
jgi:hypothetical protein